VGIACALIYFALRLIGFAFAIDPAVPPDEETHVGRILAFSKTWLFPNSGPDNHELGLLTHRPFLYSWVLGRLAAFGLDGLLALRCVNVALALGTASYGLRFIRVISTDPRTQLVFVVLLTNTLMFTGIGAAVSYDNAANLLAAAAFYYAACLLRDRKPETLAALVLCVGLGCLTKRSFLPLAVLIGAMIGTAVVLHEREQLRKWRLQLRDLGRPLYAAVVVVVLANGLLYGSNLLRFGKLVPGFEQVVGVEAARANRIFARDYILDGYREGRLGFNEALTATREIHHPADRDSTRGLLVATRKRLHSDPDWRLGLTSYAFWWGRIMLDRAMGYFGHQVIFPFSWVRSAFVVVMLMAIGFSAGAWRQTAAPLIRPFALIAVGYAGVLMLLVNHPTYIEKGILDAGVQGRYLFPVWVPMMGFIAVALCEDAPKRLGGSLAILTGALFLYSDLPSFLLRTTPVWFGP
jgi:hypothetical protein